MQRDQKNEIVGNKTCEKVSLFMDWDADHASVVSKCSGTFGLNPVLFNSPVWGKVVDGSITDNGCKHQWSLGRYIKTFCKTTHPTLGIICEEIRRYIT